MFSSYSTDLLMIKKDSKVLFIYPHPDDEAYWNAGLIQKLVCNKINLNVLCLTKGGASTLNFSSKTNLSLTEIRKQEFESVMRYLKVLNYQICDLDDGKLEDEEPQTLRLIKEAITRIKPDFVVTYEPMGVYGHPDHILVSKLITELSKTEKFKIIYSTISGKYKPSESSLKMAKNPSEIKSIKPNVQLNLTLREFIKKLKVLKLYKSQSDIKRDFLHKIYRTVGMKNEFYFTNE